MRKYNARAEMMDSKGYVRLVTMAVQEPRECTGTDWAILNRVTR